MPSDELSKITQSAQELQALAQSQSGVLALVIIVALALIVLMLLLVRSSSQRAREQFELSRENIKLQERFITKLDDQNRVIIEAGNKQVQAFTTLSDRMTEYTNGIQKPLDSFAAAIDKTLQNSITAVTVLTRVEEAGLKMNDKLDGALGQLGEARTATTRAAEQVVQSASGIHSTLELVSGALKDMTVTLNKIEARVADMPSIKLEIGELRTKLDAVAADVQRLESAQSNLKGQ